MKQLENKSHILLVFDQSCIVSKDDDEVETQKAKGVKKNVIKKSFLFKVYKKCLFTEETLIKEMNILRSQNHKIFSMTVNKVALSSNDNKRFICENKIDTLALR